MYWLSWASWTICPTCVSPQTLGSRRGGEGKSQVQQSYSPHLNLHGDFTKGEIRGHRLLPAALKGTPGLLCQSPAAFTVTIDSASTKLPKEGRQEGIFTLAGAAHPPGACNILDASQVSLPQPSIPISYPRAGLPSTMERNVYPVDPSSLP